MAVKPAPVLLSLSELAARVLGVVVTYPGPGPPLTAVLQPLVAVPSVQYSLKTALLPAAGSPWTLTFQPEPVPVASSPSQVFIVAFPVWAVPLSVIAEKSGTSGFVLKTSDPAVTANCVVSLAALATVAHARVSERATSGAASQRAFGVRIYGPVARLQMRSTR